MRVAVDPEAQIPQGLGQQLHGVGGRQGLDAQRPAQLAKDAVGPGGVFGPADIVQARNDELEVVLGLPLQVHQGLDGPVRLVRNGPQEIVHLVDQQVHGDDLAGHEHPAELGAHFPEGPAGLQRHLALGFALDVRQQGFDRLGLAFLADDGGIHGIGLVLRLGATALGPLQQGGLAQLAAAVNDAGAVGVDDGGQLRGPAAEHLVGRGAAVSDKGLIGGIRQRALQHSRQALRLLVHGKVQKQHLVHQQEGILPGFLGMEDFADIAPGGGINGLVDEHDGHGAQVQGRHRVHQLLGRMAAIQ